MSQVETMVRMGEYAVSGAGEVLVSIGLGSCIGLALIDPAREIAGLAHVMLPTSLEGSDATQLGKYADTALPALLADLLALGARRARLDAVLVGGAQMFAFGKNSLDVGSRNEAAARAALVSARLPVRAAAVGGSTGRTVRVHPSTGIVTVKSAGVPETELFSSGAKRR